MELIKVNCVSGNSYIAHKVSHQRDLPKGSKIHKCGQEFENGEFGGNFTVYRKFGKRGNKTYIVFSKYF
jgi:hypothetical protein